MNISMFYGKRILVPIKGVYLSPEGVEISGFKNTILTGFLHHVDENGDLYLCDDGGTLISIIPKISVGAIMTEGTSFYQGTGDSEDDIESFDIDGSLN